MALLLRREASALLRRSGSKNPLALLAASTHQRDLWSAPDATAGETRSAAPELPALAGLPVSARLAGLPFSARPFSSSAMDSDQRTASEVVKRGPDGRVLPHGGVLQDLMVKDQAEKEALLASCKGAKIELNDRQACDVEVLAGGGFSPLTGFMDKDTYDYVLDNMRLPGSELLFGLPVVLDTFNPDSIKVGSRYALHYQGQVLAVLEVESKWQPNKVKEASLCYKTTSLEHPGTLMIATERGNTYIGGRIWGLALPTRDFPCLTAGELRAELPAHTDVVAFQCRNPVHRAHYELFTRALHAKNVAKDAVVLVHPTCGPTQAEDIPGVVRYQTYEVLKEETADPKIRWAYLPYSMHMAGPREAIQHMLMRKNYGCTHFIIGRDMAGSKSSLTGEDFYAPYDAQEFAAKHAPELGMETVPSLNLVYTEEEGYVTADVAEAKKYKSVKLSGTEFRRRLRAGEDIPNWFAFKSVVEVLRKHALAHQK